MIVLINPYAGAESAIKKWKALQPELRLRAVQSSIYRLNGQCDLGRVIFEALRRGESDFVAAGGDGTINAVLHALLETAETEQLKSVRLGAIGLGSSNDFHKPPVKSACVEGFSCRVDFDSAEERDIGCISVHTSKGPITRYFLNNASVGVTAQANVLFNAPGRLLALLKRAQPGFAILATAIQAICRFKNIDAFLGFDNAGERRVNLSNLAVIKNPHFAGSLHYNVSPSFDNGHLQLVLCENMCRADLMKLLRSLGHSSLRNHLRLDVREATSVSVRSKEAFAVEFDGEVLTTREAQFGVLPRCLRVCTC